MLRGDGEDEVGVHGVVRAVGLRADDRPPEPGGDLLGGGGLAANVLRGYAEFRRLDDLTVEVLRWDYGTGDVLCRTSLTGSGDLRSWLGDPDRPVFDSGSAIRWWLFHAARASREGERKQ